MSRTPSDAAPGWLTCSQVLRACPWLSRSALCRRLREMEARGSSDIKRHGGVWWIRQEAVGGLS